VLDHFSCHLPEILEFFKSTASYVWARKCSREEVNMSKNVFQLDLRSLAVARVSLGLLVFFDLYRRLDEILPFYSDQGILHRSTLIELYELNWRMTLLNLNGSYEFSFGLCLLGMVASLLFMLGLRTRLANVIAWLVLISFQARFPEAATAGGDMLIRIFLFWSIFLPMSSYFSLDKFSPHFKPRRTEVLNVFSAIWVLQIFVLYFFTFLYKWAPVYHTDFEAVWYMLQLDIFTTPLGRWLGQHYGATKILSLSCYALEILGPLLILVPWKRDLMRSLMVISFWLFHIGIGLTLHLGNFAPICLIIWMGLIPASWWNALSLKLSFNHDLSIFFRKFQLARVNDEKRPNVFMHTVLRKIGTEAPKYSLHIFEKILGTFLLFLMLSWNVEGFIKEKNWSIGSPFDEIMFTLQLQQGWAMFAPHPQRSDGWWVMEGKLSNGTPWDALNNRAVSFDRPSSFYETYPSDLWRKFLDNLSASRDDHYLRALGRYLCREWNRRHQKGNRLATFKLHFMQEWTNPPREKPLPVQKITLWNHHCY
jgi:hypothetical protein